MKTPYLITLIVGFLFSLLFVHMYMDRWLQKNLQAEDFALGKENVVHYSTKEPVRYHCGDFSYYPLSDCLESYNIYAASRPVTLYLGNSQLHGINQGGNLGLLSSSDIIYEALNEHGEHLMTLSMPNMNLQEQLLSLEYIAANVNGLNRVILSISFDNTREDGLRVGLLEAFNNVDFVSNLEKTTFGQDLGRKYNKKFTSDSDMAALDETMQKNVENYLNESLSKMWPIWKQRGALRTALLVDAFHLRNSVFKISSSTTRNKIPARYIKNIAALDAFLLRAKQLGIKAYVYTVPLRGGIKRPYNMEDFESFKEDISELSNQYGARFYDFSDIIPNHLWGTFDGTASTAKKGEVDFMHFQPGGHRLLGNKLVEILRRAE